MASKGYFDTLLDNIVSILKAYSAAQITADQFDVFVDRYRKFSNTDKTANVCAYFQGFNPSDKGSHTNYPFDATYLIDCIVIKKGSATKGGDELAGARLRTLIQQVLTALFPSGNWKLSLSDTDGTSLISKKPLPNVQMLPPEDEGTERIIFGARITLEIGTVWVPSPISGTAIDSIYADVGLFKQEFDLADET